MEIRRSWRELKVMLKWRFPVLNDADFEGEEKESILSQLSIKLSKSRKELENILADLQRY